MKNENQTLATSSSKFEMKVATNYLSKLSVNIWISQAMLQSSYQKNIWFDFLTPGQLNIATSWSIAWHLNNSYFNILTTQHFNILTLYTEKTWQVDNFHGP